MKRQEWKTDTFDKSFLPLTFSITKTTQNTAGGVSA
jgi:hypothetical protein